MKNKEDSVVYVVPRKEFDYKLLKKALDFGVGDFTGNRFEGMTRNASNWIVEISNDEGSRSLSTKLIVGADGANSRVRKSLGVKTNKDRDKAIAIRAYVDSPNFVEYFNERSVLFEINLSALKVWNLTASAPEIEATSINFFAKSTDPLWLTPASAMIKTLT